CYSGRVYDLTKGDDRLTTGVQALIDEHHSENVRDAVLRAQRANARDGKAHGKIPFGYRAVRDPATGKVEKRVPDEAQAPIIREIARRVLDGDPIYAIAKDLNKRGIPTARPSKGWSASAISAMIKRPTYAGLRSHLGVITGPGEWEGLISPEDHQAILALLTDPKRVSHSGDEPKHLLSGIARCGVCKGRMRRTSSGYPNYCCYENFCVKRRQDVVDMLVEEAVLTKLEEAKGIEDFADPEQHGLIEEARVLRARLDDAIAEYTAGNLSAGSLAAVEKQLLPMITDLEKRGQREVAPEIRALIGPDARVQWNSPEMTMTAKRNVVRSLVTVTIQKAPSTRQFDPNSVKVEWA
ncbi:MAG: recombinase family protein, partial [Steroidobacteraceae bacterium]